MEIRIHKLSENSKQNLSKGLACFNGVVSFAIMESHNIIKLFLELFMLVLKTEKWVHTESLLDALG